jgi:hypothetical protein
MFVLFWMTLAVGTVNAFMRPWSSKWELEEDREFFKHPVVELDIPGFGHVIISEVVADRLRDSELTENDLSELELGKRRYKAREEMRVGWR